MEVVSKKVLPFLKWPGGKRWISNEICKIIQGELKGKYYEPFLGGGAVFFNLNPEKAMISDINENLITTYQEVRDNYKSLIVELKSYPVNKEFYYKIRSDEPINKIKIAARFLYLNRTAFGGMYRVNQKGQFNVPYGGGGRTPEILWERNLLKNSSKILKNKEIKLQDYSNVFERARKGDVIYCDPTYTVTHNNNGFINYNEKIFCWEDQERLAELSLEVIKKGVTVIISNASHISIKELYKPFEPKIYKRNSLLSPKSSSRREVSEYLFFLKKNN